ncbi:hypothetical protein [Christiangramia forsetii]|uniref:Uncharacterized protein n=2 Tax=Christiangramia forsetii TaxID=411153 RepID=A0M639_CHRFK|nr:hypothetical protein [Christiangramia forsetii]GGG31480.1 hypothetical protein GCM10011532_13710 [Christiangramia forsetii]CAL68084.1 hypothetical protein GFO_3140 [Christiangramia forsetii KT0803]
MKNIFYFILGCFVLTSCSKENLYDFKDLTTERDYIYNVRAYAADSTKVIDYKVTVFQTNGYNQQINYPYGTASGRNKNYHTSEYSVKGYKENGVLITPRENIKRIWVICYEVGSTNVYDELLFQYITEDITPVFVGYNFETDQRIVEYREE